MPSAMLWAFSAEKLFIISVRRKGRGRKLYLHTLPGSPSKSKSICNKFAVFWAMILIG